MEEQTKNNIKLGLLVLAGLLLVILTLYGLGKNQNIFGSNFELKARFSNISGLTKGNNIRFSGIQVGTVSRIQILDDTTIEVTMLIDKKVQPFMHENAVASIGTEGLMGNKIINITPAHGTFPAVAPGAMLPAQKNINTDEMLQVLSRTNNNIADISEDLKSSVHRLSTSAGLWGILGDSSLGLHLRASLANIDRASANTREFTRDIRDVIAGARQGNGSIGRLLADTTLYLNLQQAVANIDRAGSAAEALVHHLDESAIKIREDVANGKGAANALLRDSLIVQKLNASLENIRMGTDGFNQNMEALKHNFLFRGYFRKLEKQKKKQPSNTVAK
jgi:phospholipid/cholesterol/gamma-HCH transport system substrate-binding protein